MLAHIIASKPSCISLSLRYCNYPIPLWDLIHPWYILSTYMPFTVVKAMMCHFISFCKEHCVDSLDRFWWKLNLPILTSTNFELKTWLLNSLIPLQHQQNNFNMGDRYLKQSQYLWKGKFSNQRNQLWRMRIYVEKISMTPWIRVGLKIMVLCSRFTHAKFQEK